MVITMISPFLNPLMLFHVLRINRQITNNPRAVNTLQLIITKLQESDSGKYRCVARDDKSVVLQHSLEISVLPSTRQLFLSCTNDL